MQNFMQTVLLCLATAVSFLLQEWKLCSHILAYFFRVEEDFTVKIADFSLSQLCQSSNKPDVGVKSRLQKKWTAPESLRDGLFSEKSDVVGSHFQFPNVCHLIIIHSSVCLFILLIIFIYAKKKLPSSKVRQLMKAPVGLCQKPVSVILDLTIIDAVMVLTWEQFGLWFLDNSVIYFLFFIFGQDNLSVSTTSPLGLVWTSNVYKPLGLQRYNGVPVHRDIFYHDTNIVYWTNYRVIYDTFTYASTNKQQTWESTVFD